jgi:hypothetical protein
MFRGKIVVNKMQSSWTLEHVINMVSIVLQTFKLTQWLVTVSADQGHLELVSTNYASSFNKTTGSVAFIQTVLDKHVRATMHYTKPTQPVARG